MLYHKKLLCCALAVIMLAPASYANLNASRFYVLGGAGLGILDDAKIDDDGELENDNTLALRLGAGWLYNPYIGLEIDYIKFFESENRYNGFMTDIITRTSAQSIPVLGVVRVPIEQFALFAKLGASYNILKAEVEIPYLYEETESENKWEFAYGFGGEYNLSEHFSLQAEYLSTGQDTNTIMGNLVYKF